MLLEGGARALPARMGLALGLALGESGVAAAQADAESGDARKDAVVVTGSRLPPAARQTSQDVRSYDRERIEKSGQSTVTEFLTTVPEVSLISAENATGATTVRLRGQIFGSPLVLINGRRTQPVTGGAASMIIPSSGRGSPRWSARSPTSRWSPKRRAGARRCSSSVRTGPT